MGTIDDLLGMIEDAIGSGYAARACDVPDMTDQIWIPTGIPFVDYGWGLGYPLGKFIELSGKESTGKSLLASVILTAHQRTCASCYKPLEAMDPVTGEIEAVACCRNPEPMACAWIDVEKSLDTQWLQRFGVDTDSLLAMRPETAEACVDVIELLLESGKIGCLVLDSLAQMAPTVEITGEAGDQNRALLARLMSRSCRTWQSRNNLGTMGGRRGASVVIINQIRTNPGQTYGNPEYTPGGQAVPHICSIRAQLKRVHDKDKHPNGLIPESNGRPYGVRLALTAKKNKVATPRAGGAFNLYWRDSKGKRAGTTDYAEQILCLAGFWGLVTQSGNWYTYRGVKLGNGKKAAATALSEDKTLLVALAKRVRCKENAWALNEEDGDA